MAFYGDLYVNKARRAAADVGHGAAADVGHGAAADVGHGAAPATKKGPRPGAGGGVVWAYMLKS